MGFLEWLFGTRSTAEPRPHRVEYLMGEANELPIGAVRGHAVAHFKVDVRGGYFVNGARVSLEEVKRECARLQQIGGVVIYYRENAGQELSCEVFDAVVSPVIQAITEARLPLTFAGRDYDPNVKVAEYFLPVEAWPTLPKTHG